MAKKQAKSSKKHRPRVWHIQEENCEYYEIVYGMVAKEMNAIAFNLLSISLFVFGLLQIKARQCNNTPCGCPLKCYEKVTEDQRTKLFDGLWASADFNTQNACICGCIKVVEIKRRYTTKGKGSRRSNSRVYYVNNGSGVSARVCRKAFLHIHDLSAGRVDRALKAHCVAGGVSHMDKRGHHEPVTKRLRMTSAS